VFTRGEFEGKFSVCRVVLSNVKVEGFLSSSELCSCDVAFGSWSKECLEARG
jgi:hypothetical protein